MWSYLDMGSLCMSSSQDEIIRAAPKPIMDNVTIRRRKYRHRCNENMTRGDCGSDSSYTSSLEVP